MDILFADDRLSKLCHDSKLAQRRLGPEQAKLLRRRLDELRAAETLSVMRALPQARCHELTGDRAGQISVDLRHPYRLLFRAANNPLPLKPDGGLDWNHVTTVEIIAVEDTHD